ncbi:MAG: hypothetical protein FGM32_11130 [Candidatus Kapabacteria bacterium]|nr:hypothetical protein [Candidatus Kapabacteria bacterium]
MNTQQQQPRKPLSQDEIIDSELMLQSHIRRCVSEHDDPILTIDVMRAVMQHSAKPSLLRRLWRRTPMIGIIAGCFTLGFLSGHVAASATNLLDLLHSISWSTLANSTLAWVAAGTLIFGLGVWQMER